MLWERKLQFLNQKVQQALQRLIVYVLSWFSFAALVQYVGRVVFGYRTPNDGSLESCRWCSEDYLYPNGWRPGGAVQAVLIGKSHMPWYRHVQETYLLKVLVALVVLLVLWG